MALSLSHTALCNLSGAVPLLTTPLTLSYHDQLNILVCREAGLVFVKQSLNVLVELLVHQRYLFLTRLQESTQILISDLHMRPTACGNNATPGALLSSVGDGNCYRVTLFI